jgi:hypothetical protein
MINKDQSMIPQNSTRSGANLTTKQKRQEKWTKVEKNLNLRLFVAKRRATSVLRILSVSQGNFSGVKGGGGVLKWFQEQWSTVTKNRNKVMTPHQK